MEERRLNCKFWKEVPRRQMSDEIRKDGDTAADPEQIPDRATNDFELRFACLKDVCSKRKLIC